MNYETMMAEIHTVMESPEPYAERLSYLLASKRFTELNVITKDWVNEVGTRPRFDFEVGLWGMLRTMTLCRGNYIFDEIYCKEHLVKNYCRVAAAEITADEHSAAKELYFLLIDAIGEYLDELHQGASNERH